MNKTNVHVGNNFVLVEPCFPPELQKKLTYWKRSFEYDERKHTRIISGVYQPLYSTDVKVTPNGVINCLTTMPGFVQRITHLLTEFGYEINYIDDRTPMPTPNTDVALSILRDYQLEAGYTAIMSGGGIISCPTGFGKGHLIGAIIKAFDPTQLTYRNTPLSVVVAPNIDICHNNYNELKKIFGKEREVGLKMTGYDLMSDDIQVITFDSLHHINPDDIGILICDECITGDSIVTTELGNVRIDMVKRLGCKYVLTFDGIRDTFKEITDYYDQGIRDTVIIVTTKGVLRCTPEHKIMTKQGWQKAVQLEVGTKIKISGSNVINKWLKQHLCANAVVVNAWVLRMVNHLNRFVHLDKLRQSITNILEGIRLGHLIGQLNLTAIPLVNWQVRYLAMVDYVCPINILQPLDSHGTTGLNNENGLNIKWQILEDNYRLNIKKYQMVGSEISHVVGNLSVIRSLLTFITCFILKVKKLFHLPHYNYLLTRVWRGGSVMMDRVIHHVVLFIQKGLNTLTNVRSLIGLNQNITSNLDCNIIKPKIYGCLERGWQIGLGLKKLLRHISQRVCNINYVTVLSIIDSATAKVYDIEVKDVHCFYANGLLVHNCHESATDKRADLIIAAKQAMRWGMSATPLGRFDGSDLLTEGLFGPVVFQSSYSEGVEVGALVPITVYQLKCPEPSIGLERYKAYKRRNSKIQYGIEENKNLNKQVVELFNKVPSELQTLCIIPHLSHMNNMLEIDKTLKIVHAETSDLKLKENRYHNLIDISRKEREEIYDDFAVGKIRKIISTYVYKQGVNFPGLTVMLCPGGGGSEIIAGQMPGRASRAGVAGKDRAYIVDWVHEWDTYLVDGTAKPGPLLRDDQSRQKVYKKLKFEIIKIDSIEQLPFLKKE